MMPWWRRRPNSNARTWLRVRFRFRICTRRNSSNLMQQNHPLHIWIWAFRLHLFTLLLIRCPNSTRSSSAWRIFQFNFIKVLVFMGVEWGPCPRSVCAFCVLSSLSSTLLLLVPLLCLCNAGSLLLLFLCHCHVMWSQQRRHVEGRRNLSASVYCWTALCYAVLVISFSCLLFVTTL